MTTLGKKTPVPIAPSVNPLEDSTHLDTIFFTSTDKARFQNGKLRKINGVNRVFSNTTQRIIGSARSIFAYRDATNNPINIIGTNRSLYASVGTNLASSQNSITEGALIYNITPLMDSSLAIAIPNSLGTEYNASVSADFTTTIGSNIVSIAINHYLNTNELIQISGVSVTVNGIAASNFNGTFGVNVISNQLLEIAVGSPATSSGTVSVTLTWATSYVFVNVIDWGTPGYPGIPGDRIKIVGASAIGGIGTVQLNVESIISNAVNSDILVFQTDTFATSQVSNGGGTGTTIQFQIPPGNVEQAGGGGYGGGNYGAGLYGNSKPFTNQSANTPPRIWSMDKVINETVSGGATIYTTYLVLTPGDAVGSALNNGSNVYVWAGSVDKAPVLLRSSVTTGDYVAPLFVRWLYVSHNAICTLGGDIIGNNPSQGVLNQFISSDQSDITVWIPSPSNFANITLLDQAAPLVSQASTRDVDLIFTEDEVYRVVYVGKPDVWAFYKLLTTDGIVAPKARAEIEDAVFWMGKGDFFVYNDTSINILPNNTIKRYVYDNLNDSQNLQCFAYANTLYNEVWFWYVAGNDTSPNNYIIYNYNEKTFAIGTWGRTAAEEPFNVNDYPLTIQSNLTNVITLAYNAVSSYFYNLGTDPITSYFTTLGTDPFTSVILTANLTFTVTTALQLQVGDNIFISGATGFAGITDVQINGKRTITAISGTGTYTITFASGGTASASITGGGASVTIGYYDYTISLTTILFLNVGDYIQVAGATAFNNLTIGDLNGIKTIASSTPISGGYLLKISTTNPSNAAGNGGGASVTVGSSIITVDLSTDNNLNLRVDIGELVSLNNCGAFGGFSEGDLNIINTQVRAISGTQIQINTNYPSTDFSTSAASSNTDNILFSYTPSDRLFQQEIGLDEYNPAYVYGGTIPQSIPLLSTWTTSMAQIDEGNNTMVIYTMYPDTSQVGNLTLSVTGKLYPNGQLIVPSLGGGTGNYILTPTTTKVDLMFVARQRQYTVTSNELGGNYLIGLWDEEVAISSTR